MRGPRGDSAAAWTALPFSPPPPQVASLKPKHQEAHLALLRAAAARLAAAKVQSTLAATIAAGPGSPRR